MSITLRWFKYRLPNGLVVYLTNRPDRQDDNSVEEFIQRENPVARFTFCDDLPKPPVNGPPWHWYPWPPGRKLQPEQVYAFLRLMKFYIDGNFMNRPVWIHCDSSTMRAPTFFGHFLNANYDREVVAKIVDAVEYDATREPGIPLYESPITYAETSERQDPGLKELVAAWKAGGDEAAYVRYMKTERELREEEDAGKQGQ